jgi:Na+/proline symporter
MRLDVNLLDYLVLVLYFGTVLGIGFAARRAVRTSLDFFLSGRSLPAWITGLAFVSANLGAIEILGMAANGAQYGAMTLHYYWIGAVPAMVFLGVVMMPFYYRSKVRSVPDFLRRRFNGATQLLNAITFATAQVLIAGVNLYALALVMGALLGWPLWLSVIVSAAIVLAYITLGGLSSAIYNEVMQFFVILAGLIPITVLGLVKVGGLSGLADRVRESRQPLDRPRHARLRSPPHPLGPLPPHRVSRRPARRRPAPDPAAALIAPPYDKSLAPPRLEVPHAIPHRLAAVYHTPPTRDTVPEAPGTSQPNRFSGAIAQPVRAADS